MLIGRNLRLGPRVAAGGLSCRCRVSRPAHVVWRGLSGRSRDADERMFPGMSGVVGNDQEEIARRGDKILNSVGEAIGGQDSSTWQSFSVDRSGLIGQGGVDELKNKVGEVEDELDDDVNVRFSERTPLVDEIALRIKTRGPISVAEFMSLALTHPVHGYYMRRDVFNEQGDFSTAPEISNLFGELIGLWCVSNWIALGRPRRSHLVEMGPGKGTLMSDALNVFKKYPSFLNSLQLGGGITMLERSSALRVIQQSTLGCVPKSGPKPNYDEEIEALDRGSEPGLLTDMPKRKNSEPVAEYWRTRKSMMTPVGDSNLLPTRWVDDIEDLMDINKTEIQKGTRLKNTAVFVVAQELFDALPIHQFEYTKARAWRERLVDLEPRAHQVKSDSLPVTDDANTKSCTDESLQERHHFRFVLARNETPASSWLARDSQQSKADVGDKCEIGAMGGGLMEYITILIAKDGGCALMFDYGHFSTWNSHTLHGIKKHEFVHPLLEPGNVDLSADVNFGYLKGTVEQLKKKSIDAKEKGAKNKHPDVGHVHILGPTTQGEFLQNMGIGMLVQNQMKKHDGDEEKQELIYRQYHRIAEADETDPETGEFYPGMGKVYKTFGLFSFPENSKQSQEPDVNAISAGFVPLDNFYEQQQQ